MEAERISPDELAYLLRAREQGTRVAHLRAQAEGLMMQATSLEGALESYTQYLADKYRLDREVDRLRDDGVIVRASATSPLGEFQE